MRYFCLNSIINYNIKKQNNVVKKGFSIFQKNTKICVHSEVDITIVFGTIMEGSSPSGRTKKVRYFGQFSDFVVAVFLFSNKKNRTPKLRHSHLGVRF